MNAIASLKNQMALRPLWMNGILLFCLYMTFIYLPWDIFVKPLAEDQEVWFGVLFTGWAAKFGGVLHWFVYGAGAYGYLKMKRWIHPWAIVYLLQVAIGMLVWSLLDSRGGLISGAVAASLFVVLAGLSWRSRNLFQG